MSSLRSETQGQHDDYPMAERPQWRGRVERVRGPARGSTGRGLLTLAALGLAAFAIYRFGPDVAREIKIMRM